MKSTSRINKQQQVQVVIRLKPQANSSLYQKCVYLASQQSNALVVQTQNNKKQYFVFDAIANQNISQFQLYHNIGRQAVNQTLEGFNCCIFAYGQTGSGKTYSILGVLQDIYQNVYSETRGILPRLLEDLMKQVNQISDKYIVNCSYMEIYNEQIFDLLNQNQSSVKILQIRQDIKKGVFVDNLTQLQVTTYEQAINLVLQGQKNRKIAATSMNSESSRSHTIFTLYIQSQIIDGETIKTRRSKINIVDLAGSERVKHTHVEGQRLRQGCNINRSLHVLGNVINALVESSKKKKHIPFRDSKLTYYLKDSLGGNSITKLLANIQCNKLYLGDTLSTLMFAKRAKILKMRVEVNQKTTQNYQALRKQIKKLRQELAQAKFINQARFSQRFQTQNQTQNNFDGKIDTSNFQYSNIDKPLYVFEQNQLHYKALIQIYEEHMIECQMFNNQNINKDNIFNKKKNTNIMTHNQWKKIQKKNMALTNLIKKMPAFTKIYRQNQLLKQQRHRNQLKVQNQHISKIKNTTKTSQYNSQYIDSKQLHSTTIQLSDVSDNSILHQSLIITQQQDQLMRREKQKMAQYYEQLIEEIKQKFTECIQKLDKAYYQLEKQVQEKDKKIRQISKRQVQTPVIQDLIDQNQYLKLNILELEQEINQLQKDLQQNRIKQKSLVRRNTLNQQTSFIQKNSEIQNSSKNLSSSKIIESKEQNSLISQNQCQIDQLSFNQNLIISLQTIKLQTIKQFQQNQIQRMKMIDCIEKLQNQYKKLQIQNKAQIVTIQKLKKQKNQLIVKIKKHYPELKQQINDKNQNIIKQQELIQFQSLFKQLNCKQALVNELQTYKNSTKAQIQQMSIKLMQMQKIKIQLDQFITKQKLTQKQFGKSINQILSQYAQNLDDKSCKKLVTF